ncbi:MAG: hypothetical protein Q8M01_17405 [Rubrivivax sp.]|nr:hypothetical protein [Rubrivivax sp.]
MAELIELLLRVISMAGTPPPVSWTCSGAVLIRLPLVAVTVIVRLLRSEPMPTVAVTFPLASVVVAPGVTTPSLSTLKLTGTPGTVLRLLSMAVAVANTVWVPSFDTPLALRTRTRSVADGLAPGSMLPPPNDDVPADPPPPPQAASISRAIIESKR